MLRTNTWFYVFILLIATHFSSLVQGATVTQPTYASDTLTPTVSHADTDVDSNVINDSTSAAARSTDPISSERMLIHTPTVSIYPQPANNNITIKFSKDWAGQVNLVFLNTSGTVVDNKVVALSGNTIQYPVSQLSNGMYYVRMTNGKKIITKGMIVMR
jgi:hypothetical protein